MILDGGLLKNIASFAAGALIGGVVFINSVLNNLSLGDHTIFHIGFVTSSW
jgi:hypothetical protein